MTEEPKDEPLTPEQLEEIRHQEIIDRLDRQATDLHNFRQQTQGEHGDIVMRQRYHTIILKWLRDAWRSFQILPPPPSDLPPQPPGRHADDDPDHQPKPKPGDPDG